MDRQRTLLLTLAIIASFATVMIASSLVIGDTSRLGDKDPLLQPFTFSAPPALRSLRTWLSSWAPLSSMPKEERLRLLHEENAWKNDLVMWIFPSQLREQLPHIVQTWLRSWILCAAVYFGFGGVWCWYTYTCFGDYFFKPGTIPAVADVLEQIKVSNLAMPLYSLLPTLTEFAAEKGWTHAYPRVENVGLPLYIFYFVMYMTSVEFGVYWMHRLLHSGWGYKYLHTIHHKYNKDHTLSPFAGLAFHPFDGIIQAIPYTYTLFYCPMHFLTHEILLFFTGVWTTNIHDNIHGKVWPIMGARYHTIHHITYKHNHGHYTVFMDQLFDTLETPEEHDEMQALRARGGKAAAKSKVPASPAAARSATPSKAAKSPSTTPRKSSGRAASNGRNTSPSRNVVEVTASASVAPKSPAPAKSPAVKTPSVPKSPAVPKSGVTTRSRARVLA